MEYGVEAGADTMKANANEAMNAGTDAMKDSVAYAGQATAAGAQAMKDSMKQAAGAGNQAFKDTMDKSLSALNDLNGQAKHNLEALVASMTAATRGAEALGAQAAAYTKKSVEGQVDQAKAVAAARSMQEVIELQTAFAKATMEAYVAELTRASETITTAVKDTFRPINERAATVVETIQPSR